LRSTKYVAALKSCGKSITWRPCSPRHSGENWNRNVLARTTG
jgi:hypothetical protein